VLKLAQIPICIGMTGSCCYGLLVLVMSSRPKLAWMATFVAMTD